MTSNPTSAVTSGAVSSGASSSGAGPSMPDAVLGHLAARTFTEFAALLEPDVTFIALLPDGLREWHGPEQVVAAFVRWFGRAEEFELLETAVGQVGPRLHLRWMVRVRGGPFGDAAFVVQQHVYAEPGPTGRIQAMSMLCSGFARDRAAG